MLSGYSVPGPMLGNRDTIKYSTAVSFKYAMYKLFDSRQLWKLNETVIFHSTDINLIICHVSGSVLVYMRCMFEAVCNKMLYVIFPLTIYPVSMIFYILL